MLHFVAMLIRILLLATKKELDYRCASMPYFGRGEKEKMPK
jgi:hypothetical protein